MKSKRVQRGLGAVLLGAALWMHGSVAAAAEHLLMVTAGGTALTLGCIIPPSGHAYYAEAWGYDNQGRKVCEVGIMFPGPGFALGVCPPLGPGGLPAVAVSHSARVTLRTAPSSSWAMVVELLTTPATVPNPLWTGESTVTHTLTSTSGTCQGQTLTARSSGFDVP